MKKLMVWPVVLVLGLVLILTGCAGSAGTGHGGGSGGDTGRPVSEEDGPGNAGALPAEGNREAGGASHTAPPEIKGEITVATAYEDEYLTAAAKQFMKKYPQAKVRVDSYKESSGEDWVEKYLQYLNTRIMTGKAADLLFTDFLPITKYCGMGVFTDLSRYILDTPEFNEKNYFMNVLQAAREEGGEIYLVPLQANFDAVGFSTELLAGHRDMESRLEKRQSIPFSEAMEIGRVLADGAGKPNCFLAQQTGVSYMCSLIEGSLARYVDIGGKSCHLDTPEYRKLLQSVKSLTESGKGYFPPDDMDYYTTEYQFAAYRDYDVQAAFYELDPKGGLSYSMPLSDEEGNVPIRSHNCVAINSASENKTLAWEFLKYLLSEEVQTNPSIFGLAVNKKGFASCVDRYYRFYGDAKKGNGHVEKKDYRDLLRRWMEQVNDCDITDSMLTEMMNEENEKYFAGEQTAEETAKNLQKKVGQYLNE